MKVLLAGITGNVGSRLAPALIAHGHSVVAYVRQSSRNKLDPDLVSQLAAVAVGDATDSEAIKRSILDHNCDAAVNCAGLAAVMPWHSGTELPAIFAAFIKGVTAARQSRGGASPPIRVWMLSGLVILNYPTNPTKLIGDYVPMFREHRGNWHLIEKSDPADIKWSLFCAMTMPPMYQPPKTTAPSEYRGNLVASADVPPFFRKTWLSSLPLIGPYLSILSQVGGYEAPLEDCVDWIAEDFDKGLKSEYVGKRMGVKLKTKAA